MSEATARDANNTERVDRHCDKGKNGGNEDDRNKEGDYSNLYISEKEINCICNNYRNNRRITKVEFEVHKRFRTRILKGWLIVYALLLDTIQFVRLTLMIFYYCKQTNQSMLSGIMNSNDLDEQLYQYITMNGNTMFDSEYDICQTIEMLVMGKCIRIFFIIRE